MEHLASGIDLSVTPSAQPPAGTISNFVDPPSIAWAPRLAVYVTFPLMIINAALRLFARLQRSQMGRDDYVLGSAVAWAIAYNALQLSVFVNNINGRHGWDTPLTAYDTSYYQSNFATICIYNTTAALTKAALLALFLRMFHPSPAAKALIWTGIVVIVLFYLIITVISMIYIIPRSSDGGWGSVPANARAGKHAAQLLAAAGVGGTVTDFYVLCLPLYFVSRIMLPLSKKIGVGCVFLFGLIPCICSIASAVYRFRFMYSFATVDSRWEGTQMQALTIAEINVGILCGCIPVSFTLFKSTYHWIHSNLASLRSKGTAKPVLKSDTENSPPSLPAKIPRGFITGLRSFIQNGSTQAEKDGFNDSSTTYLDIQSADRKSSGLNAQDSV